MIVLDWFNFSVWFIMLIMGITLLILSGNKRYILWLKERMSLSEEKIKIIEKGSAISIIVIAVLSIISTLFKG